MNSGKEGQKLNGNATLYLPRNAPDLFYVVCPLTIEFARRSLIPLTTQLGDVNDIIVRTAPSIE